MLNTSNPTTEDIEAWLQGLKEESSFSEETSIQVIESLATQESNTLSFKEIEQEYLRKYLDKSKETLFPSSLLVLNGWDTSKRDHIQDATREGLSHYLLPEHYQKIAGGFFLKIHNKGFAINPGPYFLEQLHERGLTIHAIDTIIVTHPSQENYSEVKAIYDLNLKCNHLRQDLHLISYYLHQSAHKELASYLVPHFKQEKDCIRALEFYVDSHGLESIELQDNITLNYFLIDEKNSSKSTLGLSLEAHSKEGSFHIGLIHGDKKQSVLSLPSRLNSFDILLATFYDIRSVALQSNLIQELLTNPSQNRARKPLLLCSLETKKEGDNRLEMIKIMRQMAQKDLQDNLVILPLDQDLLINLEEFKISCSVCASSTPFEEVKIAKTKKAFGKLHYLCPKCTL